METPRPLHVGRNDKVWVTRNGEKFEKRVMKPGGHDVDDFSRKKNKEKNGLFSSIYSCMTCTAATDYSNIDNLNIFDATFYADCLITLTEGTTAYRLMEPIDVSDEDADYLPVTVLLHGMYTFSYIWADVCDLLTESELGPKSRVLIYDVYGHGRSPWTGCDLSLDVLVSQLKELLDSKSFIIYSLTFNL